MARLGLVDQTDLLGWGDSRSAAGDLPRLVRRLILETGPSVVQLGFPAGEGIATGGWDGMVRASEATAHIPQGLSLWELSVERDVGAKVERDYTKRNSTPDSTPTGECTYVGVSLRRWAKRQEWAKGKQSEGRWLGVRGYGVDDLEQWLETAPVTHAWLSELLGFHPHGLVPIDTWWDVWSSATAPVFPAGAVVAGRSKEVEDLRARLAQPPHIVTVSGSGLEDVAAFVAAGVLGETDSDGGVLAVRTALIDDVEAWRKLREHRRPLVLIPWSSQVTAEVAPSLSHHVIVPIIDSRQADIMLPPIDPHSAREALEAAGLAGERAENVAQVARLSVVAARRHVAIKPELHRPTWAKAPLERVVRRAVLAGRWNEENPGDGEVVAELFATTYDELIEQIAPLMTGSDPLFSRAGASVSLVSHADSWLLLGGGLTKDDLERFVDVALKVLSLPNPAFDLPAQERWKASVMGKEPAHSGDLRTGLATTLALLGAYGQPIVEGSGMTGSDWAAGTVREILKRANTNGDIRLWASVHDVLALLAEASPLDFLDAVRDGVSAESPLLSQIFMDGEGDGLFIDSTHSYLLWALEVCAWSASHFGQVIDLLARLTEVDPGGRYSNRPMASLQEIFCPWHPGGCPGVERRLAALDGLRQRHPAVAWRLMVSMLPVQHAIAHPIAVPLFRGWKPTEVPVTVSEFWKVVDEICARLLADAGDNVERWSTIIGELSNLPEARRNEALGQLEELAGDPSTENSSRARIYEALRSTAARHREFATADWALGEEQLVRLETVAQRFEPARAADREQWLFEQEMPDLPSAGRADDFSAYSVALAEIRAQAAAAITKSMAWIELRSYAVALRLPWALGAAMSRAGATNYEPQLIELLGSRAAGEHEFAAGYVSERFRSGGWDWLEPLLKRVGLSSLQVAWLLLLSADYPKAWDTAESMGIEVSKDFWRNFRPFGLGPGFEYVETAAAEVLNVGRPGNALYLLYLYGGQDPSSRRAQLMASALEELRQQEDGEPGFPRVSQIELTEIFLRLERSDIPRDLLARLEWAYLPIFRFQQSPATLSNYLAEEPAFFVDIISRAYRPRTDGTDEEQLEEEAVPEPDEAQQAVATNAYRLLSEWRTLPGGRADGTVDAEKLGGWVDEARAKLLEARRLVVGDVHIGQVLTSAPSDPDGAWPCAEVRDLLERVQTASMEKGFYTRIVNSRGVTSRNQLDGGEQEWDLAAKYREQAETFVDRWPRTAAVLRRVAAWYERWARRQDDESERLRRGLER